MCVTKLTWTFKNNFNLEKKCKAMGGNENTVGFLNAFGHPSVSIYRKVLSSSRRCNFK